MANWTADDIGDLGGRTAVVTGANSGLGYQAALQLAIHGARVVLACRDAGRGEDAIARLRAAAPGAEVELERLDLADLASVRAFADSFAGAHDGLDVLVNNAGVMAIPRRETVDGFEMQFGTNHLGHFALTGLLLDNLRARPGARVVTVSSNAAQIGKIDFDDLAGRSRYNRWLAYGQSKLANQLFALELDRRVRAADLDLVSVFAHPGYAATNLQTVGRSGISYQFMELGNRLFAQSDAAGALPTLYAAVAPGVRGGEYFGPDGFMATRGHPTRVPPVRRATDTDVARRLWEVSEELTGVTFDLPGRTAP